MDIPPAQDSPDNILNALNDHCIQEILRRLEDKEDFHNAAKTCIRFQENAKICFPHEFRNVDINSFIPGSELDLIDFFNNFGHLMEYINWSATSENTREEKDRIFNLIARKCGKTLKKLIVFDLELKFTDELRFTNLQTLICGLGLVRNMQLLPQLKELKISHIPEPKRYPNLQKLTLLRNGNYERRDFVPFVKLNSQVKDLTFLIQHSDFNVLKEIEVIATHLPNIERLSMKEMDDVERSTTTIQDLQLFGRLQNLKFLELGVNVSFNSLLNVLGRYGSPIEEIHFRQELREPKNLLQELPKLFHLRRLYINGDGNITNILIKLARTQPSLEELQVTWNSRETFNFNTMKSVCYHGKKLTKLTLFSKIIPFEGDEFDIDVLVLVDGRKFRIDHEVCRGVLVSRID